MELINGKDCLFYIKEGETLIPAACLTSNNMSEESETLDTTTRDNGGWRTSIPTMQSYSIALEGFTTKDDADSGNSVYSYRKLRALKRNRTVFEWVMKTLNGWYIDSGKGYLSSISESNTAGEMIGFSATLVGFGKPEESTDKVHVLGNEDKTKVYADNNNNLIKA